MLFSSLSILQGQDVLETPNPAAQVRDPHKHVLQNSCKKKKKSEKRGDCLFLSCSTVRHNYHLSISELFFLFLFILLTVH